VPPNDSRGVRRRGGIGGCSAVIILGGKRTDGLWGLKKRGGGVRALGGRRFRLRPKLGEPRVAAVSILIELKKRVLGRPQRPGARSDEIRRGLRPYKCFRPTLKKEGISYGRRRHDMTDKKETHSRLKKRKARMRLV